MCAPYLAPYLGLLHGTSQSYKPFEQMSSLIPHILFVQSIFSANKQAFCQSVCVCVPLLLQHRYVHFPELLI